MCAPRSELGVANRPTLCKAGVDDPDFVGLKQVIGFGSGRSFGLFEVRSGVNVEAPSLCIRIL